MGNTNCVCQKSLPPQKSQDFSYHSKLKVDVIDKPQIMTPYENGPLLNTVHSNNGPISSDNNYIIEEYITPEYQSTVESSYSKINKRPSFNYSLAGNEDDSVFTPESDKYSFSQPINEYNTQIYEFLFKEFFQKNYPINNEIISEMIKHNLLSQNDASSLVKLPNDVSKSKEFFDKFIFSENNISKLATFLFVIISEKSSVFYNINKSEKLLSTIVDQIYFIVNFLDLLQISFEQIDRIKSLIYDSSLITIQSRKSNQYLYNSKLDNQSNSFYVEVHLDNMSMLAGFWSIFSKINEDFQCCQEIIISSCNLNAEDTYNLIQGLKSSSVLKTLDVSANPISDQGLKHIQSLFQMKNNIETLNLTCCSLTSIGVEEFLDVLVQNTFKFHLQSLNLSHNELDDMTENSVLILTKLPLISLQLQSTNMKYQKSLYESLKLNYSLKQLDMSRNKLFNKDLAYLASGLAYNNNLKSISLSMIGLSKFDCITINNALLMNKCLNSIDLSDNAIGDEGIEILKDVLIMKKSLREIYLKRCNISLHGILILLRQASEPDCHLRVLDLCYNRCPRISMALETKELINKIYDIIHQIGLVKNIRISLWGTVDLSLPY